MDILAQYGISPIPIEFCMQEIKFIKDTDVEQFLSVGVLNNNQFVYLVNVDINKITEVKVEGILKTFNSHKNMLSFLSIIKIRETLLAFCYEFTNFTLINYLYFLNQADNLQIRLSLFKQLLELINYLHLENIELDSYNPKLFFIDIGSDNEPLLKLLFHSKFYFTYSFFYEIVRFNF